MASARSRKQYMKPLFFKAYASISLNLRFCFLNPYSLKPWYSLLLQWRVTSKEGWGEGRGGKGKRRDGGEKISIHNTKSKQYKKLRTVELLIFVNFKEPSFRIKLPDK